MGRAVKVHPATTTTGFTLRRLGIIAEPEPGNPAEVWGILNPGAARGRDGQLYLFPRVVAEGNYSRIAIARVRFDNVGIPTGIQRLGYALEPSEPYEKNPSRAEGVRMRGSPTYYPSISTS